MNDIRPESSVVIRFVSTDDTRSDIRTESLTYYLLCTFIPLMSQYSFSLVPSFLFSQSLSPYL